MKAKQLSRVAIEADLSRYYKHPIKSACGRSIIDVGDAAARALRGKGILECYTIVAKRIAARDKLPVDKVERDLKMKYKHLNPGMQRMNLGNRLRTFTKGKK